MQVQFTWLNNLVKENWLNVTKILNRKKNYLNVSRFQYLKKFFFLLLALFPC